MTDLYVWVVKEADGREGIIATIIAGLSAAPVPLVSLSRTGAEKMRPFASMHAEASGLPVRLVHFTEAETLEKL